MALRRLYSVLGNAQQLDGGAMFGNAPKALWSRWIAPDDRNRIPLACRAMLVRDADGRTLLFEVGIGAFFQPKLKDRFGVIESNHVLLHSLEQIGFSHTDIDVVVLSHLHFDHAGGLLTPYQENESPQLLFPKAQFVVGAEAWERAQNPHFRDRASFIPDIQRLLLESERLHVVPKQESTSDVLGDGYVFHYSDGHTPGLLLTEVAMPDGPVVFGGDLIPGTPWVHLPITMGYDRFPELLIEEKDGLLNDLLKRSGRLFYTHDSQTALSGIGRDDRGRFSAKDKHAVLTGLEN